jgi:murein DD-endopeptidase MepM/ murein hydrolase activator NlpD
MARLQNPWPEGRTINARSPYGYRVHPITGKRTFHHGVDVAGVFPVTAAADGVVQKVSWNATGGGHVCIIDHGDLVTVYYHGAQNGPN